jgi:hypothetical protein
MQKGRRRKGEKKKRGEREKRRRGDNFFVNNLER